VVPGATRVTVNKQIKIDHENESIYIPIGATHRLENPGKIPLELIEVQTGSYLGEETTSSALRTTTSGVNGSHINPADPVSAIKLTINPGAFVIKYDKIKGKNPEESGKLR
jgi:hypothetical protein